MSEPFLGEIRLVGFNFAPRGWAMCDGQLLAINTNQALFSLLGTTYGGNGTTTFALPDLRGRVAVHWGSSTLGERGGEENHTLVASEMPQHNHTMRAQAAPADTGAAAIPGTNNYLAQPYAAIAGGSKVDVSIYGTSTSGLVAMNPEMIASAGGNQVHNNMMPSAVVNFAIALQGIFPSRN